MAYTTAYTKSNTDTYTSSRANYITGKVYEDLLGIAQTGIISMARANKIRADLLYFQEKKALNYFEFQFSKSNGEKIGGLHYKLYSNGYIYSDDDSGKINFWGLPSGTTMDFLVSFDYSSPHIEEVKKYIKNWGTGSSLVGSSTHLKTYSKDGYGLKQNKIGTW